MKQKDNGSLPCDEPSKETVVSQRTEGDPDDSLTKPIRQCGKSLVKSSSIESENTKVRMYSHNEIA